MPHYVKYSPDCWAVSSVGSCLTLAFLFISYQNMQFIIFSMLRSDKRTSTELVTAAWQILEVVLRVSKERNSGRLSTEDLPILVSISTCLVILLWPMLMILYSF